MCFSIWGPFLEWFINEYFSVIHRIDFFKRYFTIRWSTIHIRFKRGNNCTIRLYEGRVVVALDPPSLLWKVFHNSCPSCFSSSILFWEYSLIFSMFILWSCFWVYCSLIAFFPFCPCKPYLILIHSIHESPIKDHTTMSADLAFGTAWWVSSASTHNMRRFSIQQCRLDRKDTDSIYNTHTVI